MLLEDTKPLDWVNWKRKLLEIPVGVQREFMKEGLKSGHYVFADGDPTREGELRNFAVPYAVETKEHLLIGQLYKNVHQATLRNFALGLYGDCEKGLYISEFGRKFNGGYSTCLVISIDREQKHHATICSLSTQDFTNLD